jgi:thymidylate kinase
MRGNGKLFVFEGPDNVGKTTLSQALASHLNNPQVGCDYIAFPGKEEGSLGKYVYDLHHDLQSSGIESITPTSLQALHIAAHIDLIESRIIPALESGRNVVLDRFWWSTWIYGKIMGANRRALRAMVKLELTCWDNVRPAYLFLIQRKGPIGNEPVPKWTQLTKEYSKMASREVKNYPVQLIDNGGAVADALLKITKYINISTKSDESNGPIKVTVKRDQSQLSLNYRDPDIRTPVIFKRLAPAKPSVVYDTYWRFAAERQEIFFRRLNGENPPWTEDKILAEYKFTNAYRASDRVSQYLIKHVIYEGEQSRDEVFFRILLFKLFNKIETWELLTRELGFISFADYSFDRYDTILTNAMSKGTRIYSAAYIMPSGGSEKKHRMHLKLLESMMRDELPTRIESTSSMKSAFEILRTYPTIGDFLAYQYVIDLNYSMLVNFSEMEFVVPGPGARDGIRKCFLDLGGLNETEIIKLLADRQQVEFSRLGLEFRSLWGRPLQLIDCQNLFCEVDKYARIKHPRVLGITGRTRIKQRYKIKREPLLYWYPPKWGLNDHIIAEAEYVSSI